MSGMMNSRGQCRALSARWGRGNRGQSVVLLYNQADFLLHIVWSFIQIWARCHELYFSQVLPHPISACHHPVCLFRHPSSIIKQFVSHRTVPHMVIRPKHRCYISRNTIQAAVVESLLRYTRIYAPHQARTSDTECHMTCFSIVSAWRSPVPMWFLHAELESLEKETHKQLRGYYFLLLIFLLPLLLQYPCDSSVVLYSYVLLVPLSPTCTCDPFCFPILIRAICSALISLYVLLDPLIGV